MNAALLWLIICLCCLAAGLVAFALMLMHQDDAMSIKEWLQLRWFVYRLDHILVDPITQKHYWSLRRWLTRNGSS